MRDPSFRSCCEQQQYAGISSIYIASASDRSGTPTRLGPMICRNSKLFSQQKWRTFFNPKRTARHHCDHRVSCLFDTQRHRVLLLFRWKCYGSLSPTVLILLQLHISHSIHARTCDQLPFCVVSRRHQEFRTGERISQSFKGFLPILTPPLFPILY